MLLDQACPWDFPDRPTDELKRCPGQVDWIRYVLRRHRVLLQKIGIYEPVFLSLFRYRWDFTVLRAFAERWSYTSNTLWKTGK